MENRTITTLGALQPGDRFITLKAKNEVWQVISFTTSHALVNKVNEAGEKQYVHDILKKNSISVQFLRHTQTAQP